jgi:uncharacterized protein with HEPN domain
MPGLPGRTGRWLSDLSVALDQAASLVARGRTAFDEDPALPLAFEALCNRAGDLAKMLLAADPQRFSDPIRRQAARNRDVVVHHYDRVDRQALWITVSVSFPQLRGHIET